MLLSSTPVQKTTRPTPWGRWALKSTAFSYLAVLLLIPLLVIFYDGFQNGLTALWQSIVQPVAWNALWLTLWTSALMALINTIMGTMTAYVLVRYHFPGKALLNVMIDLPLAVPTVITGVTLVALYGPQGAIGAWLKSQFDGRIIFAPPGIILALLFITFPLVVRAVQPVLESLNREAEEAAATLGAPSATIFYRVTLPALWRPIASGALLSFARAIGEFGAIVVVAGNIPLYSQTAAVYVFGQVESSSRQGASAMSVVMLLLALGLVLSVDWLQREGKTP